MIPNCQWRKRDTAQPKVLYIDIGGTVIWLNRIALALNFALFGGAIYLFIFKGVPAPALGPWEYKDIVTVLLAAVTVVLAALAILLALAAVWGYQKMADQAAERASNLATKSSQDYLNSDAFFVRVSTIAAEQIKNNIRDNLASRLNVDGLAQQNLENENGGGDKPWQD